MTHTIKKTLLLLILWLWVGFIPVQGQSVIISERFKNVTLKKALSTISKKYKVKLAYDSKMIRGIKISQRIDKKSLKEALSQLLQGQPIAFTVVDGNKVLLYKDTSTTSLPLPKINITGKIKDATSGELLPFANVRVLGTRRGTVTNVDGIFALPNMPNEEATLEVSYIGYQTLNYKITPNQHQFLIQLTPIISELKEVVIEYKTKMIEPSGDVGQISINPSKFASLPNLGENDIFRTLQWLPGINATNESTAGLSVRGSTPDQNLIYFDGFSIYHTDHFLGIFSAFNANAIKDIQVYKGGFPAKFGGRVSSVIDITGKAGDQYKPKVGVGVNMVSSNMFVELPIGKKSSLLLAGRSSYGRVLPTPSYNSLIDHVSQQPRIRYLFNPDETKGLGATVGFYDLNAKYTIRPTKKDVISLSFYNGQDNLNIRSQYNGDHELPEPVHSGNITNQVCLVQPPPELNTIGEKEDSILVEDGLRWGNTGVGFRWGRLWNQKLYSNLKIGYSYYYSTYSGTSTTRSVEDSLINTYYASASQDNLLRDLTVRLDNDWTVNRHHTFTFGLLTTYNDIRYKQVVDNCILFEQRDIKGSQFTLYAQDAIKPNKRLQINTGLRLTYYNLTEQIYAAPRASFQYNITSKFKLKGAWGIYYQFVNQILTGDLRESGYDFWTMPDGVDIPVIKSEHFIMGATYQTSLFTIDVEAYVKQLDGLVNYKFDAKKARKKAAESDDDDKPGGDGGPKNGGKPSHDHNTPIELGKYDMGKGYSQGIDILLQKRKGKYTGWIGYSYNEVSYEFLDTDNNENYSTVSTAIPHEFKTVQMLSLGKLDFSSTFVYGTGRSIQLPQSFFKRIKEKSLVFEDSEPSQFTALRPSDEVPRLPNYHRLDLAVTYNFKFGKRFKGHLSASVFNAYNQNNIKQITFQEQDTDEEVSIGGKDVKVSELIQFSVSQLARTYNLTLGIVF